MEASPQLKTHESPLGVSKKALKGHSGCENDKLTKRNNNMLLSQNVYMKLFTLDSISFYKRWCPFAM